MITIIESPIFTKLWSDYWSEDERGEFSVWIAEHILMQAMLFLVLEESEKSDGYVNAKAKGVA